MVGQTSRDVHRPAIDTALVRRLVDVQFPRWAGLPLRRHDPAASSDHAIYRLGAELSVRMPRHPGASQQARKVATWLPRLAGHLPLAIPEPVAVGESDCGFPWPWAVLRWLLGEVATVEALADSTDAALTLAEFLTALNGFEAADLPDDDITNDLITERPLADRDRDTRAAIAQVANVFPADAMTRLWNAALGAGQWDRPPVWFHGDFHIGNLLTVDGARSAVIDFGALGIGDPACDLDVAFSLLSARGRAAFRAALCVDDATWLRGRGWALAGGRNAYTSYAATNPRVATATTREITAALKG